MARGGVTKARLGVSEASPSILQAKLGFAECHQGLSGGNAFLCRICLVVIKEKSVVCYGDCCGCDFL